MHIWYSIWVHYDTYVHPFIINMRNNNFSKWTYLKEVFHKVDVDHICAFLYILRDAQDGLCWLLVVNGVFFIKFMLKFLNNLKSH